MRNCGFVVVSVLLLLHSCVLLKVGSFPMDQVTVNWTAEGVQQINKTIEARVNGVLLLLCSSYSNLVQVNQEVFETCNGVGTVQQNNVLGNCHTTTAQMVLQLRDTARTLTGSFSVTPGETIYLVSFSEGTNPGDTYSPTYAGGECMKGVKLRLNILDTETTEPPTTAAPTTEVHTSESSYSEKPSISDKLSEKNPPSTSQEKESTELKKGDPKAQGLSGSSSSVTWLHSTPSLIFLLVLAVCAVIR